MMIHRYILHIFSYNNVFYHWLLYLCQSVDLFLRSFWKRLLPARIKPISLLIIEIYHIVNLKCRWLSFGLRLHFVFSTSPSLFIFFFQIIQFIIVILQTDGFTLILWCRNYRLAFWFASWNSSHSTCCFLFTLLWGPSFHFLHLFLQLWGERFTWFIIIHQLRSELVIVLRLITTFFLFFMLWFFVLLFFMLLLRLLFVLFMFRFRFFMLFMFLFMLWRVLILIAGLFLSFYFLFGLFNIRIFLFIERPFVITLFLRACCHYFFS